MLLDCRDLSKQFIPLDPNELKVVIVNSMVKHELGSGEYAQRRKQCEEAVKYFQKHYPKLSIKALRDVTVRRRPRIGIVATGSELVEAGQPLPHGGIYDSNAPLLAALFLTEIGNVLPLLDRFEVAGVRVRKPAAEQ